MTSPTRYSPEVRERAVRLVLDHQGEHDSQWSAITSVSSKLGCTAETLRKWVRQAERDRGVRAGLSSEERRRLKELERENRELRRANEILRKASAYLSTFGRQHRGSRTLSHRFLFFSSFSGLGFPPNSLPLVSLLLLVLLRPRRLSPTPHSQQSLPFLHGDSRPSRFSEHQRVAWVFRQRIVQETPLSVSVFIGQPSYCGSLRVRSMVILQLRFDSPIGVFPTRH